MEMAFMKRVLTLSMIEIVGSSGSTEFTVSFGDADGDTIPDSCELREGTDPLDRWSYCYAPSVRIDGIIRTTNDLTCVARFGTNVILAATFLTNETFEASFGHCTATNGEVVTLAIWDDANSNSVKDAWENYREVRQVEGRR